MTLVRGTRLGPYEITAKLGAGGMGEVYRATDTGLRREVAIKVLPAAFTADKERLARFKREAQLLAQLHHPNIASIFGLADSGGTLALVMELVEGEELSALIARGPLPVPEALAIARQIAEALEAAHERGIVHRDLKPANVKVRGDGAVKVLDYGLAKAMDAGGGASGGAGGAVNSPTLMHSPTLSAAHGTDLGVILGTAAYMAPEQARGKVVDRRADVWAFGVVLFEMLTGSRAFAGEGISEVLASVLKSEPDWRALPADTPASVRRLLRRCLEKDPHQRLQAIGDARLELDEEEPATTPAVAPSSARRAIATTLSAAAVALAAGLIAGLLWRAPHQADVGLTRLSIDAPPGTELYPDSAAVAISPDGRSVAFVVGSPGSNASQLWIRSLDALVPRRLEAGDGARLPFWSPDSRSIGFVAEGKLRTVSISSGRAEVLCDAADSRGGAWAPAGVIVFAPGANGPLYRVSANGGAPVPATALDTARGQSGHRFPVFLPDGEHFLYAAMPGHGGMFDVFAGSLRDASRKLIGSMETGPVYAEPGWLLFGRHGSLAAQRFDARALELSGEAVTLDDEPGTVRDSAVSWRAANSTSASATGALAYFSSSSNRTRAVWLDALGKVTGRIGLPPGQYTQVAISAQGTQAVLVRSLSASESALWLLNLERGGVTQLSSGPGVNDHPVWSPDGSRVVFASFRDGPSDLFMKDVAEATPERPFYRSSMVFKSPQAWSPDGKWIAVGQLDGDSQQNIYLAPTAGKVTLRPYVQGPGREQAESVSPDGRWMAYLAREAADLELSVQSFPVPGHRVRISTGGVRRAWWTPDQRHILYLDRSATSLMIADVEAGETLRVGPPRLSATLPPGIVSLDPMPDRRRWVALVPEREGANSLTVVQNWTAALKNR